MKSATMTLGKSRKDMLLEIPRKAKQDLEQEKRWETIASANGFRLLISTKARGRFGEPTAKLHILGDPLRPRGHHRCRSKRTFRSGDFCNFLALCRSFSIARQHHMVKCMGFYEASGAFVVAPVNGNI
eukprot:scaffold4220_cov251-Pinguiococcus_pyrenoidosus.AAC.1